MIPFAHILILSAVLFAIGLALVVVRKNAILVLMGIELMLNAGNLNLVAFNQKNPELLEGHLFALVVMMIAAIEAAVALAIILKVYKLFQSVNLDEINEMKG